MKSRSALVIAVVVMAVVAAWWWLRRTPAASEETIAAQTSTGADAPAPASPAVKVPRVELPTAGLPANLTVTTPSAEPASPEPFAGINRGDVQSVITESIRLLEAKDYVGALDLLTRPALRQRMPPATNEQLLQDPDYVRRMNNTLTMLKTIAGQTPVLNAAGDIADFKIDPPVDPVYDPRLSVSFVKIDGKWYLRG